MELRATTLWMTGMEPEDNAPVEAELAVVVQRAIAGDRSAFEQIVMKFERRVLTLAWRLLGDVHDAQDVSQEVFLRAFRFLHRFDRRRPIEPWLIRLTVNVCRDFGRKRQRQSSSPIDEETIPACGDPHSDFSSEERRQLLYAALAELPEKERAAVVLRDIEGFSTAEVARILGSAEGTVRSQISSARLKIRKVVGRIKRGRK
jgi:RNA polymerase sigma-70 factor (ECF subfamily)